MQDQPNPGKILQTGLAFWAPKTLLSAVELRVFTELARESVSFEPLKEWLGLLRVRSAISGGRQVTGCNGSLILSNARAH